MFYLNKNFKFSLFDFKLYRPNLITNDGYINHYQKVHRDFKVTFPNIGVTIGGPSSNTKNKPTSCDKSPPSNNSSNLKISSSTPNSKSNALNEVTKLREEGKKYNEQKNEFVRVDGILKLKENFKK